MSKTMTAIRIEGGKGPASALVPHVVEKPTAGPGQILIAVKAAGINRPDVAQRNGFYQASAGFMSPSRTALCTSNQEATCMRRVVRRMLSPA